MTTTRSSSPREARPVEIGKPALLRALAAVCNSTVPEGILLQLATILDETPLNDNLNSTLRNVIPLVIGDHIKHGADMETLMVRLEEVMKNKPALEQPLHRGNQAPSEHESRSIVAHLPRMSVPHLHRNVGAKAITRPIVRRLG